MDRRHFIKTSAAGAAGLAVGVPGAEAKTKTGKTPLEVKGYVKEPARRIPVVNSADVVVVGGGPAGFAAAVAAAREGCDVLLLEREYFLGGLFTGCGVTPIINMFHLLKDGSGRQAVFGIAEELCRKLDGAGMLCYEGIRPKVDPEAAKYFMEEFCAESGVRILYGVQAAGVTRSGDSVDSIILEGKSGRVAVRCRFVVDASGDGDVLEWTGEDFTVYKNDIGAMWRIGNADAAGKGNPTPVKGVRTRHTTGEKDQDGLDMYNLTRIQLKLRKMMWEEVAQLRLKPGNEDLYLVDTPTVVGVRITRVLDSVANVTTEGAATGKVYKDVIGVTGGESNLKYNGSKILTRDRKMWQIPYSAITPRHVPNLLVGGRCFGFEKELTYDAREIGTCLLTGQAAGVAASLAVVRRQSCRDIDILDLQSKLRAQNVRWDL